MPRSSRSRSRDRAGSQTRRQLIREGCSRLTFGRHEGETYNTARREQPGYCRWALQVPAPSADLRFFTTWLRRWQAVERQGAGASEDESDGSQEGTDESEGADASTDTDGALTSATVGDFLADGRFGRLADGGLGGLLGALGEALGFSGFAEPLRGNQSSGSAPRRNQSSGPVTALLERLPRISYTPDLFSGSPHPTTCPICIEDWTDVEGDIVLTPCLHAFHDKCLRGWLAKSTDCPSCRWDISKLGDQGNPASPGSLVVRPDLGDLAGTTISIDDDD